MGRFAQPISHAQASCRANPYFKPKHAYLSLPGVRVRGLHRSVVENAPLVIRVMELRAVGADTAADPKEQFGCCQHAQSRSQEIDPESMPVAACERRPKGPRWIHAHSRQRCFEGNENRVQRSD